MLLLALKFCAANSQVQVQFYAETFEITEMSGPNYSDEATDGWQHAVCMSRDGKQSVLANNIHGNQSKSPRRTASTVGG